MAKARTRSGSSTRSRSSRAAPAAKTNPDRSLREYRRKRDFKKTNEPPPETKPAKHKDPVFVIQEHHATRLHWDLRLEADGVLKSWAVPKIPTHDPNVKRLAVRTEDHPLKYATFEGTIPEGEYGAGEMFIWDRGTYTNLMAGKSKPLTLSESVKAGHVEVELRGGKLHGAFVLVRLGQPGEKENWLLKKMRDEHAQPGAPDLPQMANYGSRYQKAKAKQTSNAAKPSPQREVKFTHEDKILFPEAGVTKGALLRYYELASRVLLPHLKDRPLTLERLPDGLNDGAPHFWQKNTPAHYPAWIKRISLPTKEGKKVDYALCDGADALLYFINQGTITIHPWFSRIESLDRPDYVVFDLDPSGRPFSDAVTVAKTLHKILDRAKQESRVKTSGKTGLHVLVPWTQPAGFDVAQDWAMEIAKELVGQLPNLATVDRSKAARGGRLYVDVIQNDRGKHAVPPYVVRATPLATVSMPLEWDELTKKLSPTKFDLLTAGKRIAAMKEDSLAFLLGG